VTGFDRENRLNQEHAEVVRRPLLNTSQNTSAEKISVGDRVEVMNFAPVALPIAA